jgi:hypothetical protein
MKAAELAGVAEALRISTREAQGLPPELTSSEPFALVAAFIRGDRTSGDSWSTRSPRGPRPKLPGRTRPHSRVRGGELSVH